MTTATFDFMAPATGKCVPIEAVHHSLSDRTLGEGIAIFPNNNTVVAPCNGMITRVSDHAVTLFDSEHDIELLLTADRDAQHHDFQLHVQAGQTVTTGTELFSCDVEAIKAQGGYVDFSCIVTNLPVEEVSVCSGDVETGKTRMFSCSCPMV